MPAQGQASADARINHRTSAVHIPKLVLWIDVMPSAP
jgi:hypothetical protein